MSKDLNKVTATGRLGADPELRYTESGAAVATFRVASNRGYRDQQSGDLREETEWFKIVAWAGLAELCHASLRKGARVYVEGRLHTSKLTDDTGQVRYNVEVVASDVIFLDAPAEVAAVAAPLEQPAPVAPVRPASSEEAERRFYARYGKQISGGDWATVQAYLGTDMPKPTIVEGWLNTARLVRDAGERAAQQPHVGARPNLSPGAAAARNART